MHKTPKNLTQHTNTIMKKIPKEVLGSWFTIEHMIYLFSKGELSCISVEDVSKADSTHICKNMIMSTYYCIFGYQHKEK